MRRISSKDILTAQSPPSGAEDLHVLQSKHSLLALLELSHDLTCKDDVYGIAETAVLNFMGHVGTTRAAVWMFSDLERRSLFLLRSQGIAKGLQEALSEVVCTELLTTMETNPHPLKGEELIRHLSDSGKTIMADAQIVFVAPLITRGSLLGFLGLGEARGIANSGYNTAVVEVLRASANIVASALDNSWRQNRMLENNRQLRAAYEELHELDRMKSDFISTLDHELKTPLTLVSTYLMALRESDTWTPHQLRWLDILNEQVDRLDGLIATLLDWKSLVEGGDLLLSDERLDDIVQEFFEERKPGVGVSFRRLTLKIEPHLPPVQLNRASVRQILSALLDNAQKFTPQGTCIEMRVGMRNDVVYVQVSDDGPGIPPDRLTDIFDAFRQIEPTLTRTHGGMGIGLAMARRLAECMDGELTASSEPGERTVFTLSLKAVERRAA